MWNGLGIGLLIAGTTMLFCVIYCEIEYYLRNKKK